ncbi:hypothetical protein NP493_2708g00004 [Ridgeia piscesae]|uniref:Uncharacterized protein n=1 Tax=Ridgeia piscesae TaxID=27915 RepID=A0AAD9N0F7_RIDPI|nr:hypothetical protein NP493_2708g00004 [Ridgeia piscesae]
MSQLVQGLQQNTSVQELRLTGDSVSHPLGADEAGRAFGKVVGRMEQLRVIELERCGLTPESLTALMAGVTGGCHQLEKFTLTGHRMGSDRCLGTESVAKSVGVFLRGTSHLRELK